MDSKRLLIIHLLKKTVNNRNKMPLMLLVPSFPCGESIWKFEVRNLSRRKILVTSTSRLYSVVVYSVVEKQVEPKSMISNKGQDQRFLKKQENKSMKRRKLCEMRRVELRSEGFYLRSLHQLGNREWDDFKYKAYW